MKSTEFFVLLQISQFCSTAACREVNVCDLNTKSLFCHEYFVIKMYSVQKPATDRTAAICHLVPKKSRNLEMDHYMKLDTTLIKTDMKAITSNFFFWGGGVFSLPGVFLNFSLPSLLPFPSLSGGALQAQ